MDFFQCVQHSKYDTHTHITCKYTNTHTHEVMNYLSKSQESYHIHSPTLLYREVTVKETRELCYCEKGSRRVQKLLNEEIEGKSALISAGFCELGSNNSHDIVLQVVAPPKKKISISVRDAYIDCDKHKLTIRDVPCGEPHMLCGQVNNTTIISTTGKLQIRFRGKCEDSTCSFDGNILFIEDPHGDDEC